ncbi:unnamed protein product, partial [Didymodactylos carnosus]
VTNVGKTFEKPSDADIGSVIYYVTQQNILVVDIPLNKNNSQQSDIINKQDAPRRLSLSVNRTDELWQQQQNYLTLQRQRHQTISDMNNSRNTHFDIAHTTPPTYHSLIKVKIEVPLEALQNRKTITIQNLETSKTIQNPKTVAATNQKFEQQQAVDTTCDLYPKLITVERTKSSLTSNTGNNIQLPTRLIQRDKIIPIQRDGSSFTKKYDQHNIIQQAPNNCKIGHLTPNKVPPELLRSDQTITIRE